MTHDVLFALTLSALAGAATGLGGLAALALPPNRRSLLGLGLATAAGVMLVLSLVELLPESSHHLGWAHTALCVLAGAALVPIGHRIADALDDGTSHDPLHRAGLITAGALALHNLPEGLATGLLALHHPDAAWTATLAVGLHNVPEGLAVP